MVKNVNKVESVASATSMPSKSYFVEDLNDYVAVHINKNCKEATLDQIYEFQDKLLMNNSIERVLNIHLPNKSNSVLFVKFKN